MYVESKRARIEREREERRRREEVRVEFSAEELALATIPGADFDPARRQFSMEELKPQPIIRKRRKVNLVKPFFAMRKILILLYCPWKSHSRHLIPFISL